MGDTTVRLGVFDKIVYIFCDEHLERPAGTAGQKKVFKYILIDHVLQRAWMLLCMVTEDVYANEGFDIISTNLVYKNVLGYVSLEAGSERGLDRKTDLDEEMRWPYFIFHKWDVSKIF